MKKANLIDQVVSIVDTGAVYEMRVTSISGTDQGRGIPGTKTELKHRLPSGNVTKRVRDEWIVMGLAQLGDVTLTTSVAITMTNQIMHDDILYDAIEEITGKTYVGTFYTYILRRVP